MGYTPPAVSFQPKTAAAAAAAAIISTDSILPQFTPQHRFKLKLQPVFCLSSWCPHPSHQKVVQSSRSDPPVFWSLQPNWCSPIDDCYALQPSASPVPCGTKGQLYYTTPQKCGTYFSIGGSPHEKLLLITMPRIPFKLSFCLCVCPPMVPCCGYSLDESGDKWCTFANDSGRLVLLNLCPWQTQAIVHVSLY